MKLKGLLAVVLAAAAVAYLIFFTKADGDRGGLAIMVDQYLEAKIELTGVNLESLSREVLAFASESGGLPETLGALRRFHPAAAGLADGWGRGFRYEKVSEDAFRLASAGPDGAFGTGDDVVKAF